MDTIAIVLIIRTIIPASNGNIVPICVTAGSIMTGSNARTTGMHIK